MDAQRLTAEGASRPLSVPAGSCLDDAGVCFLPGFRFWRGARAHGANRREGTDPGPVPVRRERLIHELLVG